MGWKSKIKEALDQPGRRWTLIPFAAARTALHQRLPCIVWPVDGGWVHWYPNGRFAAGDVGAPPLRKLDRAAEELFLFACALRPADTVLDVGGR